MSAYTLNISTKTKLLNLFRRVFLLPSMEKFLAKRTQGQDLRSFYAKLIPPNYLYPIGSFREVARKDVRYHLDLSDVVDHFIYWGLNEHSREKLYSFIEPGAVIFDVGANMGDTAIHFSKHAGAEGRVIGFEPDPDNFLRACKNISLNKLTNIQVENIGLGDKKGSFKLYRVNENNLGMNRILPEAPDKPFIEIQVDTLDQFAEKNNIKKVDLIKVDVEGFEMNVLLGAKRVMAEHRPILFIELDNENLKVQGSTAKELIGLLGGLNYRIYNADTQDVLTTQTDFSFCHYDIYALPE